MRVRSLTALTASTLLAVSLAACSGSSPTPVTSESVTTVGPTGSPVKAVDDATWKVSKVQYRGRKGIEGFANTDSVLPGEPVTLYVSSPTKTYTVKAYRMSGKAKSGALRVWKSGTLTGTRQQATTTDSKTRSTSATWKPSTKVSTDGWMPGVYLFKLAATDGSASYIPLIVRSESTKGTVVLAMSNLTWQAYNTWGGKSAYTDDEQGGLKNREYAVSFDRPYVMGKGTGKYLSYENPVVLRAERLGIPLSYVTTLDVATRPGLLDGALGYVSLGHDEYWTATERDAVETARDAGTNLAFLGANISYWQVRLRESPTGPNRLIDIYKSQAKDPVKGKEATVHFRDIGRPERLMTGQMYECYPAKGTYTVLDPSFFLFANTGAKKGSTYDGIVAVEVDRAYPVKGTPATLQVVAKSATRCGKESTWSTSSYYTVPSGAGVFTTGSMGWILKGMSLNVPTSSAKFVGTVTNNVLTEVAKGPMGEQHPAEPNLASLNLPSTNTTGSA